ncbi:MAG: c-type cytochrome [Steroidobacteraceae bacterium]
MLSPAHVSPALRLTATAFAAAALAVGLPLQAQSQVRPQSESKALLREAPAAAAAAKVASGRRLFTRYSCYSCHGSDGQGGIGARLKAPDLPPFGAFRSYLRKPAGRMPPYRSSAISDAQLADIYAYLQSIPAPPSAKSIALLNQ